MYFRLLSEAIIALNHKQSTKDEFISLCNSQYSDNQCELDKIDEFHRRYSKEYAIRWYTRDSFLFRILNNALRTQSIDVLYKLGFFITDLHHQLKDLHRKQLNVLSLPSVVYRGQFMNKDEFDYRIKNNIGGFLSINSFFSTSTKRDVAPMFTGNSSSTDVNIESIVFEIKIEIEKCRQPFADIRSLSYMEEEDEILFSVATVFRVESVGRSDVEGVWLVRLIMNGEEDEELLILSKNIKDEIGELDNLNTFCALLMKMGELGKAEEYCLMLIKDTPGDSSSMARYYSNLSMIYNEQMDYDKGLYYAKKALQTGTLDFLLLATVYTNMGHSYAYQNNAKAAISCLHEAIKIQQNILHSDNLKLIPAYVNLSLAYEKEKQFPEAIEYLQTVIDMLRQSSLIDHPALAMAYTHLGFIHETQRKYEVALTYFNKCLNIQQRTLPSQHYHLAYTYIQLGLVYIKQSNYAEAYNACQLALKIVDTSSEYPYVVMLMYILGQYHFHNDNVVDAIVWFEKALSIKRHSSFYNNELFLQIYRSLSVLYFGQKVWKKALDHNEKAIAIAITYGHHDLPLFYITSTMCYGALGDFESAFKYSKLATNIAHKILPPDHPHIQMAEEQKFNFGIFYRKKLENESRKFMH
ncbi:unnamed protein product [Adineta ricciae]|uniref:NAD(P)(+)--arginine ADP-ribosyltransferase n=1 Tax=Adineta ricciae TaxID=249248 RepID=A0A815IE60_ADIRI|nr:unnamed protein product [Adineta ricciae]CAF1497245.1 unnamed protein product [Adineta ricciae]